ncbi:MAG TPA: YsnF/AvaK domain-containing protein [Methylibium sp.]|uniref:YsnF/AvaK domain-containing protein n=1 Tax=Methylibium sp. TaxID=2067992 RepID=UPI002DBE92A3|nr:YsnF/AvaK domain-containing protein [Methylibium sp.]HEU4457661.1 YsnF/AvaK domain-containing protein [Methylibium sp.]
MSSTVVAMFDDYSSAERAAEALRDTGIAPDAINLSSDGTRMTQTPSTTTPHQDRRGFFAKLFGLGEDEDDSGHYAEAVRRGSTLLSVRLDDTQDDRADEVRSILEKHGADDIDRRVEYWRSGGYTGYDPTAQPYGADEMERERAAYAGVKDGGSMQVVQEELAVGKRTVQSGGVRVHRRLIETPVEEDIELREERAVVDRRPVDRQASPADLQNAFSEQTIEVRESREEPVVSKTARVVEEVQVGKKVTGRTETIRDSVRRSDVEVEGLHDQPAAGSGVGGMAGAMARPVYRGPERRMNPVGSYTGKERRMAA